MLKHLYINNFTLIDTLDIDFASGFSVITGETGAGKSIILGAVNLLLGQRADTKCIRQVGRKCVVEAHFDISRYGNQEFFDDNGIDYDADDCILRREIAPSGKSRAFINDTPVPLTLMRTLGGQLVDIHSQHQNLLLGEDDFQLDVVDIIAADKALLAEYKERFTDYKEAHQAVKRAQATLDDARRNEDFMRFQLDELQAAGLRHGLQDELEQESGVLGHAEEIKTVLYDVESTLGDVGQVADRLKSVVRQLEGIASIYPAVKATVERLESCHIEVADIMREVGAEAEAMDFDPRRLEQVNSALDKIYTLEQKHKVATVDELFVLRDGLAAKLAAIDGGDDEIIALKEREERLAAECCDLADRLTAEREAAARRIEAEMPVRLSDLGMPKARFAVSLERSGELGPDGHDRISFLFTANAGTAMQPVAQVASGGEIARVMLSLKAMISGAVKLPTIIFDEIDTGVSGKTAESMGRIMQEMGRAERQVVSITHLPQIAAKGSVHYKVYKEETSAGTVSRMSRLTADERVAEIARMLSGAEITPAAVSNARELLGNE